MKAVCRSLLLAASLLWLLAAATSAPSSAADGTHPENLEEVIERILELRQQIEELMQILPPEIRQEVERRWQQRDGRTAAEPEKEPPVAAATPPAGPPAPEVPTPERRPAEESETRSAAVGRISAEGLRCGLGPLDTNDDGLVSGADRQWRFLRLWFDDGDGAIDQAEIESLFDLGVRQIDVDLVFYINSDGDSEDVDASERIELAGVGTGNSPRRRGVLVIDADRLSRGDIFTLSDADGAPLAGFQALGSATFLVDPTGLRTSVVCPERRPLP